MRRRIEKSAYGRFKKQKHELDRVPGAWYRRQLALQASQADMDEDRDGQDMLPRKSSSEDELEYAEDQPRAHGVGHKHKQADENIDDDDGEHFGSESHGVEERGRAEDGAGDGNQSKDEQ